MDGQAVLLVVFVVWLVGYAVACALWPFADCGACSGSGRRLSPTGKRYGNCRRCKGKSKRLRLGRRVWNSLAGGRFR